MLNIDVNGVSSFKKVLFYARGLERSPKNDLYKAYKFRRTFGTNAKRASESEDQIKLRIANAKAEILRATEFDFVIESEDRDSDYEKVKNIYLNVGFNDISQ